MVGSGSERALDVEFDFGDAGSAEVVGRFGDGSDVGLGAEPGAEFAAQDAHAGSVDDADALRAGEKCLIEEAFDDALRLINILADDVDFGGRGAGVTRGGGDADVALRTGCIEGRCGGDDFDDVGAVDAHLHVSD